MSLEYEASKKLYEEEQANKFDDFEETEDVAVDNKISFDFSFLLAKTGEGSIENYIDHPLNFSKSKGMAQILRGVSGFVGELDLAIIDIGIGLFNFLKEGKKNEANIGG